MMNLGLRKRLGLRPSLAALDPSASGTGGGVPRPPAGYALLKGADGSYLKGADGSYLTGKAA